MQSLKQSFTTEHTERTEKDKREAEQQFYNAQQSYDSILAVVSFS